VSDSAIKACTVCGVVKPLTEYHRNSRHPDGHRARCKDCCNAQRRKDYAEHPEPEGRKQKDKAYKDTIRETLRENARQRYAVDPEVREKQKAYREANPEIYQEHTRRQRDNARKQVFAYYGSVCACCGSAEKLNIDHINGDGAEHRKALFGGQYAGWRFYLWLISQGFPPGYQTLCAPCNQSKGNGERCQIKHE
jgi:hypothetical protein